jgi:uncharacterized protein (UPF0335 family)
MKKFSKILEQKESTLTNDITDIFAEIVDLGFKIDVKYFQGIYTIDMVSDKEFNHMEFIKDLSVADDRMNDIGLFFKSSGGILIRKEDTNIKLKYFVKNQDSLVRKEDVDSWEDFKSYCNDILGVDGIEGIYLEDGDNKHSFRINVANRGGWIEEEYFGWEIEIYSTEEEFLKEYPGYEDFLRSILKRKLNYDGLWDRPLKSNINNPLRFDKEGIEVVEKLLKMAKDFPDKIDVKKS